MMKTEHHYDRLLSLAKHFATPHKFHERKYAPFFKSRIRDWSLRVLMIFFIAPFTRHNGSYMTLYSKACVLVLKDVHKIKVLRCRINGSACEILKVLPILNGNFLWVKIYKKNIMVYLLLLRMTLNCLKYHTVFTAESCETFIYFREVLILENRLLIDWLESDLSRIGNMSAI